MYELNETKKNHTPKKESKIETVRENKTIEKNRVNQSSLYSKPSMAMMVSSIQNTLLLLFLVFGIAFWLTGQLSVSSGFVVQPSLATGSPPSASSTGALSPSPASTPTLSSAILLRPPKLLTTLPYPAYRNRAVGDIDNDHQDEIVTLAQLHLYVIQKDGSTRPGWPQLIDFQGIDDQVAGNNPIIANLDNQRDSEIVIGASANSSFTSTPNHSRILVFGSDGIPFPGWPQEITGINNQYGHWNNTIIRGDPVVADLDGDGSPEILVNALLLNDVSGLDSAAAVYAFHSNGTPVSGWPNWYSSPGNEVSLDGGLVVGDVDSASPGKEVIVATPTGKIRIYDSLGQKLSIIPTTGGDSVNNGSFLTLMDMDSDPQMEIIFNNANYVGKQIYAYNGNGAPVNGWPVTGQTGDYFTGNTALGDVDGDGSPDIVAMSFTDYPVKSKIYAFKKNGSLISGFPFRVPYYYSWLPIPTLANIDADLEQEILYSNQTNDIWKTKVYAYNRNGKAVSGFPVTFPGNSGNEYVTIGNFNGNSTLDLIQNFSVESGSAGALYIADLPQSSSTNVIDWPKGLQDNSNHACVGC
jgi:hypothetical protein